MEHANYNEINKLMKIILDENSFKKILTDLKKTGKIVKLSDIAVM